MGELCENRVAERGPVEVIPEEIAVRVEQTELARPMAHQSGLVLDRTHRHEPLARTTHRL